MKGYEKRVVEAIENPSCICSDATNKKREVYYKLDNSAKSYIKVVVEFDGKHGLVVTAFRADSIKRGESVIWMPKNP